MATLVVLEVVGTPRLGTEKVRAPFLPCRDLRGFEVLLPAVLPQVGAVPQRMCHQLCKVLKHLLLLLLLQLEALGGGGSAIRSSPLPRSSKSLRCAVCWLLLLLQSTLAASLASDWLQQALFAPALLAAAPIVKACICMAMPAGSTAGCCRCCGTTTRHRVLASQPARSSTCEARDSTNWQPGCFARRPVHSLCMDAIFAVRTLVQGNISCTGSHSSSLPEG